MTRTIGVISVLAASVFFSAAPARAGLYDTELQMQPPTQQQGQKDNCLLVAKNCPDSYTAGKIDRLNREIAKGTAVYTEQELRTLNDQLNRLKEEQGGDTNSE